MTVAIRAAVNNTAGILVGAKKIFSRPNLAYKSLAMLHTFLLVELVFTYIFYYTSKTTTSFVAKKQARFGLQKCNYNL